MKSPDSIYHELINGLLERLDYIRIEPQVILNDGLYTAHSHAQLLQRYPSAKVIDIHDIDELKKISDASINLIFAHFPLLSQDPVEILREFFRVLADGGLLLFTSLGPDTFCELRESFRAVDSYRHAHDFVDMHHVGDCLKKLNFTDPVMDREVMTILYENIPLFFSDLKSLQATSRHEKRSRGLMSRMRWKKMLLHYDQLKIDNAYPVSIELIFGHAWKMKKTQSDEFVISVDQIRRKQ